MAQRTAEVPNPSTWLYNNPLKGTTAEAFFVKNRGLIEQRLGMAWMIGDALILNAPFETWTRAEQDRYTKAQVTMTKTIANSPVEGSELWLLRQAYTDSVAGANDFNGSKLHLNSHSRVLTDTGLHLDVADYDWHGMRVLGMGLREGRLPDGPPFHGRAFPNLEAYRDGILPTRTAQGFIFDSLHPNNMVVHAVVETSDGRILVTQKPPDADYDPNALAVSIEEQMHGKRDNSPFDTVERAIGKIGGEELKLTPIPEETRLAAMILETRVNAVGFIMRVKVEESADQINADSFGPDRAEFDPTYLRTISLDPKEFTDFYYNPRGVFHATSKIRMLAAFFGRHGYQEGLTHLYEGYRRYNS